MLETSRGPEKNSLHNAAISKQLFIGGDGPVLPIYVTANPHGRTGTGSTLIVSGSIRVASENG